MRETNNRLKELNLALQELDLVLVGDGWVIGDGHILPGDCTRTAGGRDLVGSLLVDI